METDSVTPFIGMDIDTISYPAISGNNGAHANIPTPSTSKARKNTKIIKRGKRKSLVADDFDMEIDSVTPFIGIPIVDNIMYDSDTDTDEPIHSETESDTSKEDN